MTDHSSKRHRTSLLTLAIAHATNLNYEPAGGSIRPSASNQTPQDATQQESKADAAFQEGEKLRKEGSSKSFRKAIDKYEQGLLLYRAAGNRGGEAKTLNNIGGVYDSLGEKQKALEFYNQALPINLEASDRDGEAITLNNIGLVYHSLGDADKALKFYNQALPLRRAVRDRSGEATTLNNIGSVYESLGEIQKALEFFDQALPIYRALGDRGGEAGTLNNIGAVYYSLGQKWKALEYFKLALAIHEAAGDRAGRAVTLNNIGLIYHSLGFNQKTLEFCTKALRISRAVGDRSSEARALNNLGTLYAGGGWDIVVGGNEARRPSSNIFAGNVDRGQPPIVDMSYEVRRTVIRARGDNRKALKFYLRALALRRAVGDRRGEAVSLNNIGIVYKNLGQRPKALEFYNQARLLAGALRIRGFEATTLQNLMVFWGKENPSLAIFFGKQAVNVLQELRSVITSLDTELQQTFLRSKEQTYRDLAGLLISQGRLAEAQQVFGLLKEEEYFEFVRRDSGNASLTGARISFTSAEAKLKKQFSEIAASIAGIGSQHGALLAIKQRSPEQDKRLSEAEANLEIANQAYQKFLDQLQVELKGATGGVNDVTALRESRGLQDTLRELDAIALYTIVSREMYNVILITPDVEKAFEYKISEAEINRKIFEFRQVLQNPAADPLPLAQELYRIFIGPELGRDISQTGKQTIVWSLDGVLRYLPMAALHDGKRYLVESYRNVIITLASRDRLKDPVSLKWQALGLGVSKGEVVTIGSNPEIFPPLRGVPEELAGIVRDETKGVGQTGVLPGTVLLDEGFTAEAMKTRLRLRGNEQPFKLVHIASHFRFQPGDETKSFLLMGGGKTLTLAELKSMSQIFSRVELLTLSACNTAVGGAGAEGKEVEGFAVLAQRQGAEAIIASLWPVSDMSTSQLMRQFYRLRDEHPGMSKAEAMRQAQLTLLRPVMQRQIADENKDRGNQSTYKVDPNAPYAHPYFWAPFILIGNWR